MCGYPNLVRWYHGVNAEALMHVLFSMGPAGYVDLRCETSFSDGHRCGCHDTRLAHYDEDKVCRDILLG